MCVMMPYYFAYGSNMNPQRMALRGLETVSAVAARLDNMALRFNKKSRRNPRWACANIAWSPGDSVEGVLYGLSDGKQIVKMDPFEGTPRYYSRERFMVSTEFEDSIPAWTYIANPAVIDNNVLPLRWYLEQLLAGKAFLSPQYRTALEATPCLDEDSDGWS